MTDPQCPKCKGEIQMGVAIHPSVEFGERICWVEPPLLNYETIKMIDVYKCKCCGYSCDDEHDLNWKVNNETN